MRFTGAYGSVTGYWTVSGVFIIFGYLAVSVDHRSQELPGSPAPIHADHPENLEEPETPDGRGGEHIPLRSSGQNRDRGDQHHDVWGIQQQLIKLNIQAYINVIENMQIYMHLESDFMHTGMHIISV